MPTRKTVSSVATVQWVLSGPNTVNGGTNRHVIVPGVRAAFSFSPLRAVRASGAGERRPHPAEARE
jgi:hypothetical protein